MKTLCMKSRKSEQGFTLVELAVVMIIIGLLIGGVLKGQELITGAQITSTVSQLKAFDAATSTFRDTYNAFPGDMSTASTRLPNCAADPCNDGTGDGRLDVALGDVAALDEESAYFFNHLRAADLVTGLDGTATLQFGLALPAASIGGGYMVGYVSSSVAPTGFTQAEFRPGHYLVLTGQIADVADGTGVVNPAQAARIDRKIDDGRSTGGGVVSGTTAACRDGDGYNEDNPNQLCNLAIRVN